MQEMKEIRLVGPIEAVEFKDSVLSITFAGAQALAFRVAAPAQSSGRPARTRRSEGPSAAAGSDVAQ